MQFVISAMSVLAGLVFSFIVALAVEEFIFGKVLRILFVQAAAVRVRGEAERQRL